MIQKVVGGSVTTIDDGGDYILEKNVEIPVKADDTPGVIRANIYRPKTGGPFPVLATYGPYGKDIPYADFHPKSCSDVNPNQKSKHSAWEVPDPAYWTSHGYAIVRADECGCGQSPGLLDTMSRSTSECFFDVIEWAAKQSWSSGRVGLLGVSYYAGTQWRVAARRPNGLAAIIPWEGMSDYYRDRVRHGGILSNTFISRWWNRQVGTNQYGLPGRAARKWNEDTLEGDMSDEELSRNRRDQTIDTARYRYRDDEYFSSKDFRLEDIEVPLLSVANWGGISLHLRGNIQGYRFAGSKQKWLRCITGRHDLPFYYDHEVELQRSFLDAFLKGEDDRGWLIPGKIPAVDLCLRDGEPAFNNAKAELSTFPRRWENEWPIARTQYQQWHLHPDQSLTIERPNITKEETLRYKALEGVMQFLTAEFMAPVEITGHPTLTLSMSVSSLDGSAPYELDLFVTLRHINADGKEVLYTGTSGDPVPIVKGWLRASLRAINSSHLQHSEYSPYRNYFRTEQQPLQIDQVVTMVVEIWPTNVVIGKGGRLLLEIAGHDTEGSGFFCHNHPEDRQPEMLRGWNNIHIGPAYDNFLTLPMIPKE